LGTPQTRILIDAGLTAGAIEKKLAEIQVPIESIQAILITHEHIDHIRALPILTKKWDIPIFANAETAKGIVRSLNFRPRFKIFTTGEPFSFGDLQILAFSIPHDTLDPVAFSISTLGKKIGICTDLGHVTSLICKMLEKCDHLYIEANHQPSMVHASARPPVYKQRVLSKQGHLSNEDCARLIQAIAHPELKSIHLAHLSSECNSPELAMKMIQEILNKQGMKARLEIAYQDKVSSPILF